MFQKRKEHEQRRAGYRKRWIRQCALFLSIVMIISILPAMQVKAAGVKLYYLDTKKTVTYTGTRAAYEYNGNSVSLGKITGILTDNGVALGPYYEIFSCALGISCKKGANNSITFRKDDNVLVLTPNSKTAVLNGKSVAMSAAPVMVKFMDAGITRIMVPTRFVAESLGYNYRWDSDSSTAIIRDMLTLSYNKKQVSYLGTAGRVNFDGKEVSLPGLPSITFVIGDIVLSLQENSTAAYRNGEYLDCGVAPILVTNVASGTTEMMVPGRFVSEHLGFDYNWNSATKTSEIRTTDQVGVLPQTATPTVYPSESSPEISDQVEYSFVVDAQRYLEFENTLDNARTSIARSSTGNTGVLQGLTQNLDELYCEQYVLKFDRPIGQVQSVLSENLLTITVGDTYAMSREYKLPSGNLVTGILQKADSAKRSSSFALELSDTLPYYNLDLSSDGCELSITIFPNYLVGLEVGKNQTGQYMRFKGVKAFQYTMGTENGYDVIYFHNTCNTAGNLVFPDELFGSYFEHAYMVETDPNQIKLLYKLRSDTKLRFASESNALYMYFGETEQKPGNNTDTTRPVRQGLFASLPDGVTISDLVIEDQYWNRRIVLPMPGDYTEFYKSNAIRNPYPVIEDISVLFEGGRTKIILTTTRIQGYRMAKENGGFSLHLGNPSEIYDKIVVLDAGHGGIDPGAAAGGYNEKDINFTILNQYTKEYFEGSDIKIYFTRTSDVKIDLYERADFASRVEADMFISLHMNAASATSAAGTSVYYSVLNTSTTSGGLTGKQMATTLAKNLSSALGTKNRGIIAKDFVVVRETRMPAVLIELAFITNASDRKIITTPATQKKAAKTIYDTVVQFFKDYPTGR